MARKFQSKSPEEKKAEVQALLSKLEAGVESLRTSEGWAKWLTFQASLYRYSWNNCLLIASQLPTATVVMGYRKWQAQGRQVRKGEKSLKILAPCFRKVETTDKSTGETKEESRLVYFRAVPVFDISQTEGETVPAPCTKLQGDDAGLFDALKAYSEGRKVPVRLESVMSGANGYYDCIGKFIAVEQSNAPAQQAKTLAHEVAHSILHSDLSKDEQSREDRELEAESVAFIVCQHFGLDTSSYSFGYVANWKGAEAKEGFRKSAKRISETAKAIIEALEGVTEEESLEDAA